MAAVELGRIAAGLVLDPTHAQEVIVEDLTLVELVAVGYADRHERFFFLIFTEVLEFNILLVRTQ